MECFTRVASSLNPFFARRFVLGVFQDSGSDYFELMKQMIRNNLLDSKIER